MGAHGRRPPLPTRSSRVLLAYLALNQGRLFHRDVVAGILWGERPDRAARKLLRNSLWRVRCALDEAGESEDLVRVEGPELGFLAGVEVDTAQLVALSQVGGAGVGLNGDGRLADAAVDALERAVSLYRGDLLEGYYEEWTVAPRESLRLTFLQALERLFSHHMESEDYLAAIARGRELVRHDPYRERIHRALMMCHWAVGDRPLAVLQYQACERVLREELDMEPMEETRELHDRIRRGALPREEGPEARIRPARPPGRGGRARDPEPTGSPVPAE